MTKEQLESKVSFTFQPFTTSKFTIGNDDGELYNNYVNNNWEELCNLGYYWTSHTYIYKIYSSHSIHTHFNFREIKAPVRCLGYIDKLSEELTSHLKMSRKRLRKSDIKVAVKFLVKHMSRVYYHKAYGLIYYKHKLSWVHSNQQKQKVNRSYFLELISMLEGKGLVKSYVGYGTGDSEDKNVKSLLIFKNEFVDLCIGSNPPDTMDECLMQDNSKGYQIRERIERPDGNGFDKVERELIRGEKMIADSVTDMMVGYSDFLQERCIEVNGVRIPEWFLYRAYIQDFFHGGRITCHVFQNKSKKDRLSTIIDGKHTVSLDFKSLHYCLAAELKGFDMKGHDPYQTNVSLYVDWYEVLQYEAEYGVSVNPIRNICKTVILIMLNAKDRESAKKAIAKEFLKDFKKTDKGSRKFVGLTLKGKIDSLIDDVVERNPEISEYFCSDFGIKAMYYESEIMQEAVNIFKSQNKVILPVHDSGTVSYQDLELGLDVLRYCYKKIMKTDKNCIIEIETL